MIRILEGLVLDTIECLEREGARIPEDVVNRMAALWEEGTNANRANDDGMGIAFEADVLADHARVKCASRNAGYPLMFDTAKWRLFVNPWKARARIAVNAEWLHATSKVGVVAELRRVGRVIFGDDDALRISRLDIAGDFVGLDLAAFVDRESCVTRAKGVEDFDAIDETVMHTKHREVTGVRFGSASSRVQAVLYDKTRQAKETESAWTQQAMRDRGWDGIAQVIRIEFRIRQRGLDEYPEIALRDIATLERFDEWAPRLWRSLTTDAIRFVTPNAHDAEHRSRWDVREDWIEVQGVGTTAVERRRSIAQASRIESVRRAARSIKRGLVTLLAQREDTSEAAIKLAKLETDAGRGMLAALLATTLVVYDATLDEYALKADHPGERLVNLIVDIKARRRDVASWEEAFA